MQVCILIHTGIILNDIEDEKHNIFHICIDSL